MNQYNCIHLVVQHDNKIPKPYLPRNLGLPRLLFPLLPCFRVFWPSGFPTVPLKPRYQGVMATGSCLGVPVVECQVTGAIDFVNKSLVLGNMFCPSWLGFWDMPVDTVDRQRNSPRCWSMWRLLPIKHPSAVLGHRWKDSCIHAKLENYFYQRLPHPHKQYY